MQPQFMKLSLSVVLTQYLIEFLIASLLFSNYFKMAKFVFLFAIFFAAAAAKDTKTQVNSNYTNDI
jgi:hypothetical protein